MCASQELLSAIVGEACAEKAGEFPPLPTACLSTVIHRILEASKAFDIEGAERRWP